MVEASFLKRLACSSAVFKRCGSVVQAPVRVEAMVGWCLRRHPRPSKSHFPVVSRYTRCRQRAAWRMGAHVIDHCTEANDRAGHRYEGTSGTLAVLPGKKCQDSCRRTFRQSAVRPANLCRLNFLKVPSGGARRRRYRPVRYPSIDLPSPSVLRHPPRDSSPLHPRNQARLPSQTNRTRCSILLATSAASLFFFYLHISHNGMLYYFPWLETKLRRRIVLA